MKRTRSFRPTLHPLEDRIALSLSFTGMMHSLFPFIHSKSHDAPKHGPVAARLHPAHSEGRAVGANAHPTTHPHTLARPHHAPHPRGALARHLTVSRQHGRIG